MMIFLSAFAAVYLAGCLIVVGMTIGLKERKDLDILPGIIGIAGSWITVGAALIYLVERDD